MSGSIRKNQIQYNQIQEQEGEAADAAALPLEVSGSPPDPIDAFVTLWHTETPDLPRCLKLTVTRRRHIRQRLIDRPLAEWAHVFELVQASAFCRGANDRGWRADLDWIIGSPDVALKILEGKYDTRGPLGAARPEWRCPSDPPCPAGTARWRCHQRAELAAEKARASA